MKNIIIILLTLTYSGICHSQNCEFFGYGMEIPSSNTGAEFIDSGFQVENKGNGIYVLAAFQPKTFEVNMKAAIEYKELTDGYYHYSGSLLFFDIQYECVVMTKIKLSEFANGKGNTSESIFDENYIIKIFFYKNKTSANEQMMAAFYYPVNIEVHKY